MYKLLSSNRLIGVCGSLAVAAFFSILTGCGDTFRPIVVPGPQPGVDPGTQRTAVVLTQMPAGFTDTCAGNTPPPCPGVMMQINVGGDTNSSGFLAPGDLANYVGGRTPTAATFGLAFSNQIWVANRDSDSVTQIVPSLGLEQQISLPSGAKPTFITVTTDPVTPNNDLGLVANTGDGSVPGSVSFIDIGARALRLTATVLHQPVSIAAIPPQRKLYVVNRADNNISVISSVDGTSLTTITLPAGTDPVSVVVNSGATAAYVVNHGSGSVSVIDTSTDLITQTIPTGAGPTLGVFDPKLLRVYVLNTGANSVTVIDASSIASPVLRTVSLPAGASNPVGIAALRDGTRFYTANSGTNNVTVFDAQSFAVRTTIPVGTNPVAIAASSDSSRVYVTNHDATLDATGKIVAQPGITIIRAVASPTENPPKAADTVVTTLFTTFVDPNVDPSVCPTQPNLCIHQVPVFVVSQ